MVIDTPAEVDEFAYNQAALGNNVLVGKVDAYHVYIQTYTIGI
jgi:hypothetical protein